MSKKRIIPVILLSLIMLISLVGGVINVTDIIGTTQEKTEEETENIDATSEESGENLTLPDSIFFDLPAEDKTDAEAEEETTENVTENNITENTGITRDTLGTETAENLIDTELVAGEKTASETKTEGRKIVTVIGFGLIFILAFAATVCEFTGTSDSLPENVANVVSIGKVNNIGKRAYQQDSVGADVYDNGIFGIVADGMGGLSGGDEISSAIVVNMLQNAQQARTMPFDETLLTLTSKAINEVNRKLGISGYYKSGSTLVAVYVKNGRFHWISIGDSRIYLYRNGALMQINREHTYENELLHNVLNNELSFNNAKNNSQVQKLTSFIGMGKIKHSDLSTRSMKLLKGDRLLLMSDGVFGTLSEDEIAAIICKNHDCKVAATAIETAVSNKQKSGQDNFTALIIGF